MHRLLGCGETGGMARPRKPPSPFRYFNSSPEVIRLVVMLLAERGIDICHETVRFWWNRFEPMFAAEIRKRRVRRCGPSPTVAGTSMRWA